MLPMQKLYKVLDEGLNLNYKEKIDKEIIPRCSLRQQEKKLNEIVVVVHNNTRPAMTGRNKIWLSDYIH